ncbi:MAG: spore germination protein [Clostridia bacterium]|nr:spore germination protein [Clostridia bacterium]
MTKKKKEHLLQYILSKADKCDDLILRELVILKSSYHLLYIEGLCDIEMIEHRIIRPLLKARSAEKSLTIKSIKDSILPVGDISLTKCADDAIGKLFSGNTLLFTHDEEDILAIDTAKIPERAVTDPAIETVVRGARDSFTESIKTNISLVRKRIKNNNLKVENTILGQRSNTSISIMYIDDIVLPDLLHEIKKRLDTIEIDVVLESGYIEQLIEENTFSPFPQILYTERPDKVAASLLEGRVAIFTDGTPLVLIAPAVFNEFFISSEDYYERVLYGSFLRFFRFLASIIGLVTPAFYIAFSSYHPEMLPTELILTISGGRANVPFPPIVEIIAMEFTVEIIREASIRLPGQIGPTLSIVGALVLGEAAVSANLVSPSLIIVIALTTIGNIAIPNYSAGASLRLLRFLLTFITAILGLFGLVIGLIFILIHLTSLKSFGIPYFAPYGPFRVKDVKDTLIRLPMKNINTRPRYLRPLDKIRQAKRRRKW